MNDEGALARPFVDFSNSGADHTATESTTQSGS